MKNYFNECWNVCTIGEIRRCWDTHWFPGKRVNRLNQLQIWLNSHLIYISISTHLLNNVRIKFEDIFMFDETLITNSIQTSVFETVLFVIVIIIIIFIVFIRLSNVNKPISTFTYHLIQISYSFVHVFFFSSLFFR